MIRLLTPGRFPATRYALAALLLNLQNEFVGLHRAIRAALGRQYRLEMRFTAGRRVVRWVKTPEEAFRYGDSGYDAIHIDVTEKPSLVGRVLFLATLASAIFNPVWTLSLISCAWLFWHLETRCAWSHVSRELGYLFLWVWAMATLIADVLL